MNTKYDELLILPINLLLSTLMNDKCSEETIFKLLRKRSAKLNNPDDEITKKRIAEFIQYGFLIEQDDQIWVIKKQFFPVEVVTDYIYIDQRGYQQIVKVLSASQIDLLKEKGYGISSYKFALSNYFLGNVYCEGSHPNLEPGSSKFCVSQELRLKKPTLETIEALEDSFTQVVLHKAFFFSTSNKVEEIRRLIR